MSASAAVDVVHNAPQHRFEATLDGALARLEYRVQDGVMTIYHTEVPPAFAGRGIAGALMQAAIDHARAATLRVAPACSYAQSWMQRNPQSLDLVARS